MSPTLFVVVAVAALLFIFAPQMGLAIVLLVAFVAIGGALLEALFHRNDHGHGP